MPDGQRKHLNMPSTTSSFLLLLLLVLPCR
jgi:hypothetical protein